MNGYEQDFCIVLYDETQLKAAFEFYQKLTGQKICYFRLDVKTDDKLIFSEYRNGDLNNKNIEQWFQDKSIINSINEFDYSDMIDDFGDNLKYFEVTFVPGGAWDTYEGQIIITPAYKSENK